MGELILSTIVVPMNDKELGLQLKKARLEKSLSQESAGALLGVTWEMISRYENGRSSALKHLHKLAEIYDKPLAYFFGSNSDAGESFNLSQIVTKLKEEGVGYRSYRNVIKIIDNLTGRGIDEDLAHTQNFYEVSTSLTQAYPSLFALKLNQIEIKGDLNLNREDIALFAKGIEVNNTDIVIGYDGITYKLMKYSNDSLDTPLAILIAVERRIRD